MPDEPSFSDVYGRIMVAMWPLVDYIDPAMQKSALLTSLTVLHSWCLSPKKKAVCRAAKALIEANGAWSDIVRLAVEYYNANEDFEDFEDSQALFKDLEDRFTKLMEVSRGAVNGL